MAKLNTNQTPEEREEENRLIQEDRRKESVSFKELDRDEKMTLIQYLAEYKGDAVEIHLSDASLCKLFGISVDEWDATDNEVPGTRVGLNLDHRIVIINPAY